jgi:electron transfer flavoprotein alpha subunit
MSAALLIAEHDGTVLAPATASLVGAAAELGVDRVDLVVAAAETAKLAELARQLPRVDRVLTLTHARNTPCVAAIWAPQIAAIAAGYSHVLAPATTFGKDLLPRIAALLGIGVLSDITAIESAHQFLRPVYAGNALLRIAADPERIVCATVRPTAFASPEGDAAAVIEAVSPAVELPSHTRWAEHRLSPHTGPDLQTAARVVAAGRGVGGPDHLPLIERLADALHAAVGASRAAVDAGWATNDMQIGQTGKIIAPSLYIAVGISGAIQHLTGIKDAGTVVAINQDASAPICAAADLIWVADLFAAVPALIAALDARNGSAPVS